MTPEALTGPVSDLLEENGLDDLAAIAANYEKAPTLWSIRSRSGRLIQRYLSYTRSGVIRQFTAHWKPDEPKEDRMRRWRRLRDKSGFRAVRVRLIEEPRKEPA